LTGTDPNRSYFWSGNVRAKLDENERPYVQNEDIENGVEWPTFPERLEQQGISWKVYQNEIAADGGFTEEEDVWLGNFGDNPLEYFKQYNVKLSKRYIDYLPKKIVKLGDEIKDLQTKIPSLPEGKELSRTQRSLKEKEKELQIVTEEQKTLSNEKFDALNEFQKTIHQKAFAVNTKDPDQHKLEPLNYKDGDTERNINIPKGDIFHQFREDVETGKLPAVSWLVAPEFFSDHPSAPWFGSWYLSEAMDILTKNPEVWKKTIFILAYDENDGYFDHVPPFVAPDPRNPSTGKVSGGIDTSVEYVRLERDSPGSIGLGYRVPLVIASPWSRGGWVNSQVFDHTSTLQFLESFLSKKFGKKIEEPNISLWRRTVCGDLTSTFRPDNGEKINELPFLAKDNFIESVHKAKFKNPPNNFKNLSKDEIDLVNKSAPTSPFMPQQEKGTREACALPYELYVDGRLSEDKKMFWLKMRSSNEFFGDKTAGSPFSVYAPAKSANENVRLWSYGVAAGDTIKEQWALSDFENDNYHLFIHGPNGFYREFKGNANDPLVEIMCAYQNSSAKKPTGNIELKIGSANANLVVVEITDNAYKAAPATKTVNARSAEKIIIDLSKSHGWYDLTVKIKGNNIFEKRYAGHVETGNPSHSDPLMGGVV
ncbi:MAG TPA: alkaline phosphatase family protein, partial [Puia sp.]